MKIFEGQKVWFSPNLLSLPINLSGQEASFLRFSPETPLLSGTALKIKGKSQRRKKITNTCTLGVLQFISYL